MQTKPSGTRFVGRRADLFALNLSVRGARLVTVVGPPGIGKTRLVTEYFWGGDADPARAEQVYFCDLTEASDLDGFCRVVGVALGLELRGGGPETTDRIARSLAGRGGVVLVLDNFEQLLPAATRAVSVWLAGAPEVRFVVTSRERLGLSAESLIELTELSLPESGGDVGKSEAVSLFVDRTRAVCRDYVLGDRDAPHVAAIVERLDGNPLAIELAAARMRMMGAAQLAALLPRRLDLLAERVGPAGGRRLTLWSAIDWSWRLLTAAEQAALAQCAVFRGAFDFLAAEAVLDLPGDDAPGVLDVLQSLCDKSLLRTLWASDGSGARKLCMYLAIREYAEEKLTASAGSDAAFARHAAYYLRPAPSPPPDPRTLDRLAEDLDNLLQVHERACIRGRREDAVRAALAVDPLLRTRGPRTLGASLFDRALASPGEENVSPDLLAQAFCARAEARRVLGRVMEGAADLDRAAELAERMSDVMLQMQVLRARAQCAVDLGRLDEALDACTRALALCRANGVRAFEGNVLDTVGYVHLMRGELSMGRAAYHESARRHREMHDRAAEGISLSSLAFLDLEDGDLEAARLQYEEAYEVFCEVGNQASALNVQGQLGAIDVARGHFVEARARLEGVVRSLRALGESRAESYFLFYLARCHHEDGRLDDARVYYAQAFDLCRSAGHVAEPWIGAHVGWLAAEQGDLATARLAVGNAEALSHASASHFKAVIALCRAHVCLAEARQARREHDLAAAEAKRRETECLLVESETVKCLDVRMLVRRLREGLEDFDGGLEAEPARSHDAGSFFLLSPSGRWFRLPGGREVSLPARRSLRLILLALAERRLAAPDEGLSVEGLLECGWPGERVHPLSGASRVYVAVATLRKLGLRELLLRRDDGYLLDPRVPIRYVPENPSVSGRA